MGRAPTFCAVVLAAGESTRMGQEKALLPWPPPTAGSRNANNQTFLSSAIATLSAVADMVFIVVGNNEDTLAPVIFANGAFVVRNPEPELGQFSSLHRGLRAVLDHGRDAAIITLVDRPPVGLATLSTLMQSFQLAVASEKWAVVPEYQGRHGHPIFAGREMIEAFLRAPRTSSARDVLHAHQDHIEFVPVDDAFVALNVNTPEDYAALLNSR